MKRILSFALLICLLFSLAACSKDNATGSADWQEQYNLGIRYLADGKYEEAILAFTAAIDIDPKQAEAYIGRAEAYLGSGETTENLNLALADYTEATTRDKNSHAAYLGLGNVQLALDDAKGAQESYQKAIKLDKSSIPSYLGLSNAFAAAGDLNAALDTLLGAVDTAGESAELTDRIAELEAQGAVASGESGNNASGENSNGENSGSDDGNGPGGAGGMGSFPSGSGLAQLQIANLNMFYSTDGLDDARQHVPDAVGMWTWEFEVIDTSVSFLAFCGYNTSEFTPELVGNMIANGTWDDYAYMPPIDSIPSYQRTVLTVTPDTLNTTLHALCLGLDENQTPIAYISIPMNIAP